MTNELRNQLQILRLRTEENKQLDGVLALRLIKAFELSMYYVKSDSTYNALCERVSLILKGPPVDRAEVIKP
jgi:hypothetical protein